VKAQSIVDLECYHGLLVDEQNHFNVVCWTLPKFYDLFESDVMVKKNNEKFDWNSAIVMEKMDGILVCLYYYGQEWHLASEICPNKPESPMCWKHEYHGNAQEKNT